VPPHDDRRLIGPQQLQAEVTPPALPDATPPLGMQPGEAQVAGAETLAERRRLIAETLGVGFWSRDLHAGVVHWDEQMYRIHRRPPAAGPPGFDEWIDQYVHPAHRACIHELHQRASAEWAPVVDAIFRAPDDEDGRERWVQTWTRRLVRDGHRLAFGMHLDVSERERSRMIVERERARTQFAIDAADLGVWERGLDGTPAYWNDTMYRLRGLSADDPRPIETLARGCAHPDDYVALNRLVRQHVEDGTPYRCEFRVRLPDGRWRWLVTQGRALRDGEGRLLGMAGINLDITERKEADALRQQTALAEQSRRDQSAFLARVSHELRTPMNAVLGFTQLLTDDDAEPPTPRQRQRLQRIAEAGAQMMVLVDDLLELAHLEAAPPAATTESVPLADVVRQVLAEAAGLCSQQGVQLQCAALAQHAAVRANRRRLVQLVTHLVGHMVRRQRRGGRVQLVGALEHEGDAALATLTLHDDGPAYSPAEATTLFEPFQRHDPATGSGMGLALAWRLSRALGGRIELAAAPTQPGSGLRLLLPADPVLAAPAATVPVAALSAAPPAEAPSVLAARTASPPLRVLCVEDNPVNLLLVRELLALRPGVVLRAALDGRTGVTMALAERPDVLLLDLQLPDIGGLEVLRRLRAEPAMAGCVYVALSANAMPDHVAAARAAGFDDYWTKPIDFERFLSGIDRLAAGHG
jgi:PAS domain S-box-containing protein